MTTKTNPVRYCLKCDRKFPSPDASIRLCDTCKKGPIFSGIDCRMVFYPKADSVRRQDSSGRLTK